MMKCPFVARNERRYPRMTSCCAQIRSLFFFLSDRVVSVVEADMEDIYDNAEFFALSPD